MTLNDCQETVINYQTWRHGASRIAFRGPAQRLDEPYTAIVGGSETFGKFVSCPFAELLQAEIGTPVVNLGVMHAGLSLVVNDPAILEIASNAQLTVVQVLGATNMSNRFYSVHPRRNDRFVSVSRRMHDLFPDVDFADINFTGHLLAALEEERHPAFDEFVDELKTAWVERMRTILGSIRGDRLLLWMSERRPEEPSSARFGVDPMFVDRDMLEALSPCIGGIVEVVANQRAREEGLRGKLYRSSEEQAAAAMPGPSFHEQTAAALAQTIGTSETEGRAGRSGASAINDQPVRASR
ncbi:MAG: DUF6473 family protein [Boseongicola sp.]